MMSDAVAWLEADLGSACEVDEDSIWESDTQPGLRYYYTGLRYYYTTGGGTTDGGPLGWTPCGGPTPPIFSIKNDHPNNPANCVYCNGHTVSHLGPEAHKRSHP